MDVQSTLLLVMVLLMWGVALRAVKRAQDVLWVVAFWVTVCALYMGLLAIFGVE